MDPFTLAFTSGYLGNLGATLSGNILSEAGRKIKRAISGEEIEQAFNRCIQTGIVAVAQSAVSQEPEKTELLKDILDRFFQNPDVGGELSEILNGREPDHGELNRLFKEAGYDSETLPGIQFDLAIDAFTAAFLSAATLEPPLQPVIQTTQLLEQTRIQQELLDTMKDLAAFLKESKPDAIGIQAETIIAENVVSGQQYQFTPGIGQEPPKITEIRTDKSQVGVIGDHVKIEGGVHFYSAPNHKEADSPDDHDESRIQRDALEAFYLQRLMTRCDPLELAAIEDSCLRDAEDARTIKVSDIYTTLCIKDFMRQPDEPVSKAIKSRLKGDDKNRKQDMAMDREEREKQIPIQATEAAGALQHLVVLGQPGGGKSTLVNHMAAQLARRRMADQDALPLQGWEEGEKPLPIRIILRQFAAWLSEDRRKDPEGLVWEYLRYQFEEWECGGYFEFAKHILNTDGGVIFFDGLDEVSEADEERKRERILEAVRAFSKALPKCRILVTCREYAYRKKDVWRLPEADFPVLEIDLFHNEQIEAFAHTWYRVTGANKGWTAEESKNEASALVSAIKAMPHLRELAPSPLLLTLMAIVHGSKGLPQDRADLYERAVALLLAHWENRIIRDPNGGCHVEPSAIMKLGLKVHVLREPLEQIALTAHERQENESENRTGCADIPREDLREELAAKLNGSLDKAEEVIDYIQNRAGLLQAKDNRTFAFPHRTFQEYLAATGVMRRSDFETFLKDRIIRDTSWWREVFLLAAGASRSTPRIIYDLVDTLIPDDSKDKEPTPETVQYARLGAQAMGETDFLRHVASESPPGRYAKIHKRIQDWLLIGINADDVLMASDRCGAGDALNWVVDPRFDPKRFHLPDDDHMGFVKIPEGEFLMGSNKDRDENAKDRELPQHTLDLPEFWINRYPVTVTQFRAFVESSGDRPEDERSLRGFGNHPVVYVSWHEALAYCKWLTGALMRNKSTPEPFALLLRKGWQVSLPSEAEWETAARGSDGRIYPWGDNVDPNKANYAHTGIKGTSSVGSFPGGKSPFGLLDMAGNVWEWTRSIWGEKISKPDFKYPYNPADGREDESSSAARVLRGGSWDYGAENCRTAIRFHALPGYRLAPTGSGFLCAQVSRPARPASRMRSAESIDAAVPRPEAEVGRVISMEPGAAGAGYRLPRQTMNPRRRIMKIKMKWRRDEDFGIKSTTSVRCPKI